MGKIFVIMGKTSSGKDTIYKHLLEHLTQGSLKTVVIYTTRPRRPGETDGVEYFFVTEERLQELRAAGMVVEERCYNTVHGPWYYFTVNDGQIDLSKNDYLMISTLAGYEKIRAYYNERSYNERNSGVQGNSGKSNGEKKNNNEEIVVPIYIEADEKDRLLRYINRESLQAKPNYSEVCRRFLADEADFAEAELERLGITKRYFNQDLERCCQEIRQDLEALLERGQSLG